MTNNVNLETLRNSTVFGNDGEKIGTIGDVYLDDQTQRPTFATVNTGLFGLKETFVPLDQAQQTADGITVPFDKAFVKDAPNIDADGSLTPEEEQRIYDYYSVNYGAADRGDYAGERHDDAALAGGVAGTRHDADLAADRRDVDVDADRRNAVAGDNDVVAHEEHLTTGNRVESRETGRVRLRKHVVTDTETVEVPVRREEVHIEREKIDPNSAEARVSADRAFEGDGEEVIITTREERPVVDTEVVATERVSLDKEVHTDTERVSADVRREEIVVDEDVDGVRRDDNRL